MDDESVPTTQDVIESPAPTATEPGPAGHKPVASYLHTALVIAIMVAVATMTAATMKGTAETKGPFAQYIATIIWLWLLAALVAFGIRRSGSSIREVIGTPWRSFDDALMDLIIAGGFWITSAFLLAGLRYVVSPASMPSADPGALKDLTKHIAPLLPHTSREIFFWILMSLSAGFCEEFVFRGYLQRQFTALTKNATLGILISAAIFSVGHLYQGGLQMALIGAYGAMFGILAYFRKNLRPGMIAHAWQDILSGVVLSLVLQHAAK
ncbi:MAG: Abortive infection protein [Candidatus Angelobacter sp.]|nr:Abortive infection protein [Candidatus Angelobacter sp.]